MNWSAIFILATVSYFIWYDWTMRHPRASAAKAMLGISLIVYAVYLCGLWITAMLGIRVEL